MLYASFILDVLICANFRLEVCGLEFDNGGAPIDLSLCSMPCSGNSSEFCGGPNALNVSICLVNIFLYLIRK